MSQTKIGSIAEAWANIAVGFSVNFCCNFLFMPMVGAHRMTITQNLAFGCIMTVISLVRSYVLRRWFNGLKFGNAK